MLTSLHTEAPPPSVVAAHSDPWHIAHTLGCELRQASPHFREAMPVYREGTDPTLDWFIVVYVDPHSSGAGSVFPREVPLPYHNAGHVRVEVVASTIGRFKRCPMDVTSDWDVLEPAVPPADLTQAETFLQQHADAVLHANPNLSALTTSAVRHKGTSVIPGTTIVCHVRQSGLIPVGCEPLSVALAKLGCPFGVDVREGTFDFTMLNDGTVSKSDVRVGCSIGLGPNIQDKEYSDDERYNEDPAKRRPTFSLGGFVETEGGDICILSCAHVLRHLADDATTDVILPSARDASDQDWAETVKIATGTRKQSVLGNTEQGQGMDAAIFHVVQNHQGVNLAAECVNLSRSTRKSLSRGFLNPSVNAPMPSLVVPPGGYHDPASTGRKDVLLHTDVGATGVRVFGFGRTCGFAIGILRSEHAYVCARKPPTYFMVERMGVDTDADVSGIEHVVTMHRMLKILPVAPNCDFTLPGDSGGLVVQRALEDRNNTASDDERLRMVEPVGIVSGYVKNAYAIATPIGPILVHFRATFLTQLPYDGVA